MVIMEGISNDLLMFILGQVVVGAGLYGAIRADLKNLHENQVTSQKSLEKAHERIDQLFQAYWQNKSQNWLP